LQLKTQILYVLLITLLFNVNSALAGTTYTWNIGSSGNWTTASNWSPNSGYPGSSGTTDIAVINTSGVTISLSATVTIAQLETTSYGFSGITISVGSGNTLNIGAGVSTTQPASAAVSFTFGGTGTTKISGTVSAGYQSSFAIAAGATVYFNASSVFDESTGNPHGNLTNNGTLNILSGANLKFGDFASLVNSGTGTIHSYGATFTFSGSGSPPSTITNSGTIRDHGSTYSLTGQSSAFTNSGASSNFYGSGTTITYSSGNGGMSLSNAGTFKADSASIITLGNTNPTPITNTGTFTAGTSGSPCTINLTGQGTNINNSKTFNLGSTSVINPSGTSVIVKNTSPGIFTLQSDVNGSATIGALSGTASCSGLFSVQRYIQGGAGYRSYRLLSSQVFTNSVSSVNVYDITYLKNYIYLTGTTTTGGFDNTVAANPTLYLYRENLVNPAFTTFLNSNFIGISKINNAPTYAYSMNDATYTSTYNIPVGSGILCFYRGDRYTTFAYKTTAPFPIPENDTLTTTGTLNTGTITARNWFNPGATTLSYTPATVVGYRGFNLVGNPYPSTIDWETYSNTSGSGIYVKNVSKIMYLLNPLTQNYDAYQKGGAYTNHGTRYIVSGQAFFVLDTLATTGFLVFNESAKVNNQNTGLNLFMAVHATNFAGNTNPYLRLQMAMDTVNTDDILISFNSIAVTTYNPGMDAPYKNGFGKVSLSSISSDHIALAINTQPLPKTSETIHLNIGAKSDGIYSLNMKNMVGIPQLYDVWLMDNYKKDSLDMRHNSTYSFKITVSDTNSYGANRFSLVLRQNPGYAYRLLNFTAAKVTSTTPQVQLTWITENEQNYTGFTVERSTDNGKTFTVVGGLTGDAAGNYGLTDKTPVTGINLYRLKSVDINGNITYSYIVPISYSDLSNNLTKSNINVYPNPASSIINLAITADLNTQSNYNIQITNSTGLVVKQATSAQPNWQSTINDLLPGTYVIKVLNSKNGTLVGDSKFVKQ
jgi:trimeric autotransporter adhesin